MLIAVSLLFNLHTSGRLLTLNILEAIITNPPVKIQQIS